MKRVFEARQKQRHGSTDQIFGSKRAHALDATARRSLIRNTFWKRQDTWEEQFEIINRQIQQINETTQIEPSQATPINVEEQEYVEIDDFRRALDDLERKILSQEIFLH